jgi:undecaprenyl-diphosphatase
VNDLIGEIIAGELILNNFLQNFSSNPLNIFFQLITYLGHPAFWVIISAWFFWAGKEKKSLATMSVILFASVISGVLKFVIARPRPEGLIVLEQNASYSFPSGHSTIISAMYFFAKEKIKTFEKQILLISLILVAISRLYLGVHYLTDVIAGLILGYIIGKIVWKFYGKIKKMKFHITKIREEFLVIALILITLILLAMLPEWLTAGFVIAGYFLGYAIFRHTKIQTKPKNKNLSIILGTTILALLALISYIQTGILSQILFLITGVFITLIWPYLSEKLKL